MMLRDKVKGTNLRTNRNNNYYDFINSKHSILNMLLPVLYHKYYRTITTNKFVSSN